MRACAQIVMYKDMVFHLSRIQKGENERKVAALTVVMALLPGLLNIDWFYAHRDDTTAIYRLASTTFFFCWKE